MIIYTDGSCLSNGNPDAIGGYSIVAIDENTNEVVDCIAKRTEMTTNNREELKAVLFFIWLLFQKSFIKFGLT